MNDGNERALAAAEEFERQETLRAQARIRAELEEEGVDDCIVCGDPIPTDRKMAYPSAIRCIECQRASERKYRD